MKIAVFQNRTHGFGHWQVVCSLSAPWRRRLAPHAAADNSNRRVLIRDITSVEGVRDNMLVGYGLVVGLNRTGDSQQTYFTVQTLANAMQKMGVLISPTQVEVKNVAAVFITASLPPFARPARTFDVTVSSVGDAKSLSGGVLLMSALHGPDGQVYAEAQGPLIMGGYTAGNGLNGKEVNSVNGRSHPERRHRRARHFGGSARFQDRVFAASQSRFHNRKADCRCHQSGVPKDDCFGRRQRPRRCGCCTVRPRHRFLLLISRVQNLSLERITRRQRS